LDGIARLCSKGQPIVVDVKSLFNETLALQAGITYWRL
jgi:hypothetical protein